MITILGEEAKFFPTGIKHGFNGDIMELNW